MTLGDGFKYLFSRQYEQVDNLLVPKLLEIQEQRSSLRLSNEGDTSEDISNIISDFLNEQNSLLKEVSKKLDQIDSRNAVKTEVLTLYPETLSYTVREYLQMKGVDDRHLNTMRKRAVMFANQGKQINLPRKGNEYVFRGNDISYLDQALKTVLGLD